MENFHMNLNAQIEHELLLRRANDRPQDFVRYFNDFITIPVDDTTGIQTEFPRVADAGATAVSGPADGKGGWGQVTCDGDDNDECYEVSASEAFIFNTTDKVAFEARVKHTAGSTDGKGSFIIGLSDVGAANTITDAGSIVASFDGAVFIKGEDDNIDFVTSNAAVQTRSQVKVWTNGATVKLGFLYHPNDGVTAKVTPLVDGIPAVDSAGEVIIHDLTISGLEEMHILRGVKTHEGAEQILLYDFINVAQTR